MLMYSIPDESAEFVYILQKDTIGKEHKGLIRRNYFMEVQWSIDSRIGNPC